MADSLAPKNPAVQIFVLPRFLAISSSAATPRTWQV